MSFSAGHIELKFHYSHSALCRVSLMLAAKEIYAGSPGCQEKTGKKKRRKGKNLLFSSRKELRRSRERALANSSKKSETLQCNNLKVVNEGRPHELHSTAEETPEVFSPTGNLFLIVSEFILVSAPDQPHDLVGIIMLHSTSNRKFFAVMVREHLLHFLHLHWG